MKFDDKYPNTKYLNQKEDAVKGDSYKKCCICGGPTSWLDLNFQVYVCSEECTRKLWAEYIASYNNATDKYGPPTYAPIGKVTEKIRDT